MLLRTMKGSAGTASLCTLIATLFSGCGASAPSDGENGGSGSTLSDSGGGGNGAGNSGNAVGGGDSLDPGGVEDGGTGGALVQGDPVDPCVIAGCSVGQTCQLEGELATCIDKTCEELMCTVTEECRPHEQGGVTCVNLHCVEDVDCDAADHCSSGGDCIADVCTAGENSCGADGVHVCSSNGSSEEVPYSCGGKAYFTSECGTESGVAACSCEDDWDCPEFTVCDVDHCVGTGFEPTCTLPPTDFNETEPAVEIHWGTDTPGGAAHDGSGDGSSPPWPHSTEVQTTPIVVNLNDDNGDGLVNELDYPEIVFVSFTSGQVDNSGIMRAIHGGGPNRGKDFWAVCGSDNPTVWHEGDPLPTTNCNGVVRSRSPAAVGDINNDGLPEIVQVTSNNGFQILSNLGEVLVSLPNQASKNDDGISLSPTIANLDYAGLPELIFGGTVYKLDLDATGALVIGQRYDIPNGGAAGANGTGGNRGGPMTCIADITDDPGQEIIAGPAVYRMPATGANLEVVRPATGLLANEGLCAVADIWGADTTARPGLDNRPDGKPEVILIGEANLMILNGATGAVIHQEDLDPEDTQSMRRGGAPNVDDFDGDGFLEIASALSNFYVVVDLQEPTEGTCPAWPTSLPREFAPGDNPNAVRDPGSVSCTADTDCGDGAVCNIQAGSCVCLHNGWKRESDDSSSKLTSSSVFDFNGDGAAEVLYNDECDFRIYDGLTGEVHFSTPSRSRTWTENPVVADVDNDGNAEVVTLANTEPGDRCIEDGQIPTGANGVRVFGDPQDTWVPARRIWNQQSYHVTNVTESGQIPVHPPESWGDFNGLTYNTYRSQPRTFGVAPDLQVTGIGIFSPNAECGTLSDVINITFEVSNTGDLRVGPGVELQFYGTWGGVEEQLLGADGSLLTASLPDGVDPGRSLIETATFEVAFQPAKTDLPDEVRVVVDTGGAGSVFGSERECDEANNTRSRAIVAGEALADLNIVVGEATLDCNTNTAGVSVTVNNTSLVVANNVIIQLFAGNPAQGGTVLAQKTLDAPLAPGGSTSLAIAIPEFPTNREVTVWGFVDPGNVVSECNEADNTEPADNPVECKEVVIVVQ